MKISHLSTKQKICGMGAISFVAMTLLFLEQSDIQAEANAVVKVATAPVKIPVSLNEEKYILAPSGEVGSTTQNDFCDSNHGHIDCDRQKIPAPVAVDDNAKKNEAWKVDDVKSPTPSIRLNERILDYEIVEIQHPETFPQVGEQITLPMLNGEKVVVDVQSISTSANGDQSWSGHLQGQGTDYPVIMTYGAHAVFATITTPEGSYSMESVDGLGWLYKNPSEFELSDASANDFLEVNEIL